MGDTPLTEIVIFAAVIPNSVMCLDLLSLFTHIFVEKRVNPVGVRLLVEPDRVQKLKCRSHDMNFDD